MRKGCGDSCVLRPSLQWIAGYQSQAHATLFAAKFFGRSDLIGFLSAVPHDCKPESMLSLDARHMELFLSEGFLNGNWKYKHIGARDVPKNTIGASVAIFDIKHLNDRSTSGFQVKYHVMKAGNDGEVVSIRVSLPV